MAYLVLLTENLQLFHDALILGYFSHYRIIGHRHALTLVISTGCLGFRNGNGIIDICVKILVPLLNGVFGILGLDGHLHSLVLLFLDESILMKSLQPLKGNSHLFLVTHPSPLFSIFI